MKQRVDTLGAGDSELVLGGKERITSGLGLNLEQERRKQVRRYRLRVRSHLRVLGNVPLGHFQLEANLGIREGGRCWVEGGPLSRRAALEGSRERRCLWQHRRCL